ncbi:MAG: S9 family peptidase [Acidobacteriota bacterium]
MHSIPKKVALASLCLLLSGLVLDAAQKEAAQKESLITPWMVAGPLAVPPLVYGPKLDEEGIKRLIGPETLDPLKLWPQPGSALEWAPGSKTAWKVEGAKDGRLEPKGVKGSSLFYASTYLRTQRWEKVGLSVDWPGPLAVYLDGTQLEMRAKAREGAGQVTPLTVDLILPAGLHRLFLAALLDGGVPAPIKAVLTLPRESPLPFPAATTDWRHTLQQSDVMDSPFVSDIAVSGDGSRMALVVRNDDLKRDDRPVYLEVRSTVDGRILANFRVAKGTNSPYFSPHGNRLVFTAPDAEEKESETLWIADLETGQLRPLLKEQRNIKEVLWAPKGDFIYFLAVPPRTKPAKSPAYVRFTQMVQRWSDWEDRPQAFELSLEDKTLHQLTAGPSNVQSMALSPDGRTLALLRIVFTEQRPYLTTEIWSYDTESGASRKVMAWPRWPDVSEIAFSPDGKRLALIAPPADMPPGGNKPREELAYNLMLYTVDLASGQVNCLTDHFTPAASSQAIGVLPGRRNVWWSPKDGHLYFIATEGDRVRFYRTDPEGKSFTPANLPDSCLGSPDMASSGAGLGYVGSSFGTFWTVRYYDLATGKVRDIWEPGAQTFARVELTRPERFDFTDQAGVRIPGWLFLPPHLDPAKRYPMIVAYYGGVEPYADCFRPEFFRLSGQGYVVYLVTPRGSVGYGLPFADDHVNDWGQKAGEDILEGTRAVLAAKSFVDAKRVGCYGGSYGGFMTLYLVSHSDLFAAAVDFFGISDITSYWGAGWWGFSYGDTALAMSYPWNRRDLFVDRSPVYRADKIHAPLLLLHGDSDVNVPHEESDQIFTALRILGRPCEYVRFAGEDHGINGKPSNRMASEDMMQEWFDKYLKGEPEAWSYRWEKEESPLTYGK